MADSSGLFALVVLPLLRLFFFFSSSFFGYFSLCAFPLGDDAWLEPYVPFDGSLSSSASSSLFSAADVSDILTDHEVQVLSDSNSLLKVPLLSFLLLLLLPFLLSPSLQAPHQRPPALSFSLSFCASLQSLAI